MKVPILGIEIDERFFIHRQRSMSWAGIVGAWVGAGLLVYHYVVNGIVSWDLVAVLATMGAVKLAVMAWYFSTE